MSLTDQELAQLVRTLLRGVVFDLVAEALAGGTPDPPPEREQAWLLTIDQAVELLGISRSTSAARRSTAGSIAVRSRTCGFPAAASGSSRSSCGASSPAGPAGVDPPKLRHSSALLIRAIPLPA